jgi:hypothetical protein
VELLQWMPDTRFLLSQDTKLFRMVEIYWHNKSFIAQIIEEKGFRHKAILHKLDFLETKYDALITAI